MQININTNAEQVLRKLMQQAGFSSAETAVNALILNFDPDASRVPTYQPRLPDVLLVNADELLAELPRIPTGSRPTIPAESRKPEFLDQP